MRRFAIGAFLGATPVYAHAMSFPIWLGVTMVCWPVTLGVINLWVLSKYPRLRLWILGNVVFLGCGAIGLMVAEFFLPSSFSGEGEFLVLFLVGVVIAAIITRALVRRAAGESSAEKKSESKEEPIIAEGLVAASERLIEPMYCMAYAKANRVSLDEIHAKIASGQLFSFRHKGVLFVAPSRRG